MLFNCGMNYLIKEIYLFSWRVLIMSLVSALHLGTKRKDWLLDLGRRVVFRLWWGQVWGSPQAVFPGFRGGHLAWPREGAEGRLLKEGPLRLIPCPMGAAPIKETGAKGQKSDRLWQKRINDKSVGSAVPWVMQEQVSWKDSLKDMQYTNPQEQKQGWEGVGCSSSCSVNLSWTCIL